MLQVVIQAVLTRPRPGAAWATVVLQGWGAGQEAVCCHSQLPSVLVLVLVAQHCTLKHAMGQAVSSLLLKRRSGFELMYLELRSSLLPLFASVAIFWLDQTHSCYFYYQSRPQGGKVTKIGHSTKMWLNFLSTLSASSWFGTGKVYCKTYFYSLVKYFYVWYEMSFIAKNSSRWMQNIWFKDILHLAI